MKIIKEYKTPAGMTNADMAAILENGNALIAGTAGAGKSVLLHNVIYTALGTYTPADAQYIFIDPKLVELGIYKNLPNTITRITDHAAAAAIIGKLLDIALERYADMEKRGSLVNWDGKRIFVFIDELADLMTGPHGKQFAANLTRLLQISRAAGISCICCTQCPNRRIIPAEITCNLQTRVALRCISAIESRQVINARGAEELTGYGRGIKLDKNGYSEITFEMVPRDIIQARVNYWMHYKPEIYIKL